MRFLLKWGQLAALFGGAAMFIWGLKAAVEDRRTLDTRRESTVTFSDVADLNVTVHRYGLGLILLILAGLFNWAETNRS